jgi:hypothetical protein
LCIKSFPNLNSTRFHHNQHSPAGNPPYALYLWQRWARSHYCICWSWQMSIRPSIWTLTIPYNRVLIEKLILARLQPPAFCYDTRAHCTQFSFLKSVKNRALLSHPTMRCSITKPQTQWHLVIQQSLTTILVSALGKNYSDRAYLKPRRLKPDANRPSLGWRTP